VSAGWIEEQLVARGISDTRVLDAMRRVPREEFVPAAARWEAYADRALPIGGGLTISQPYMVAVMSESLRLTGSERVLDVGTGSGYQAAILAELAREVVTIERVPDLADAARQRLAALGYANIEVIVGDGTVGVEARAPYDAILVAAGAPRAPKALKDQLSAAGGRLVIPIGPAEQQRLVVITRDGDRFSESAGTGCVFVPLVGEQGW
jgi:protein-L-isoaspartate(D-aspartate) O-methyltransferase